MTQPIHTIEGHMVATGKRFAIVASRWNSFVSERMISIIQAWRFIVILIENLSSTKRFLSSQSV